MLSEIPPPNSNRIPDGTLKAIREAIPAANSRTPEEVLAYVRDTLMAADAKVVIDAK